MDQMQNAALKMIETVSAPKTENRHAASSEPASDSTFRKLMDERTEQANVQETPEESEGKTAPAGVTEQPETDELDAAYLQELAAMQMFCANPVQTAVTQQQQAQQQAPVLEEGAVLKASGQPAAVDTAAKSAPSAEQAVAEEPEGAALMSKPVAKTESAPNTQGQENGPMNQPREERASVAAKQSGAGQISTEDGAAAEPTAENTVFGQVESAPVKVSETTVPTEPTQTESVEAQIAEKLTKAVTQDESKVEVQLQPEHLGKITIELTKKEDGSLHIVLHAENSQTKSLLERDISGLQTLLNRTTQQEVRVEVQRQQENQQSDFQDGRQQQQHNQERRHQRQSGEDFLNQLRLGLIPLGEAVS